MFFRFPDYYFPLAFFFGNVQMWNLQLLWLHTFSNFFQQGLSFFWKIIFLKCFFPEFFIFWFFSSFLIFLILFQMCALSSFNLKKKLIRHVLEKKS
jgi:hypothetical protein